MKSLSSSVIKKLGNIVRTSTSAAAAVRDARKLEGVAQLVDQYVQKGLKPTNALYDIIYSKPVCKTCGTGTPAFQSLYAGYKTYCSHRCTGTDPDVIAKKSATCLKNNGTEFPQQSKEVRKKTVKVVKERYGVDNVSRASEVKEKRTATFISHYGVDNPRKSEAIKSKIRKINRERWGDEYPQNLDIIKEKTRDTVRLRYGVDNVMHLPEVRERIRETLLERYGVEHSSKSKEIVAKRVATCERRYGGRSSMASEHVKAKMRRNNLKKYGVEHIAQDPEIADRMIRNSSKAYDFEYGRKVYRVRGYEKFAFPYFKEHGFSSKQVVNSVEDGLPTFWHSSGSRLYVPDFYVRSKNLVVEIKSTYTVGVKSRDVFNIVKAKARAVSREGFGFLLLVFDRNGFLIYESYGPKPSLTAIRQASEERRQLLSPRAS